MSQHSSRGSDWNDKRRTVLERDGYVCVYCHNAADTVDHITPKNKGGTDDEHNLVAACRPCNSAKGDRLGLRLAYCNPRWLEAQ